MTSLLKHELIASSLLTYWRDNFPPGVATAYPGTRIDTTSVDEWVELSIDVWPRRAQRAGGLHLTDLSVSVHCFVKQQSDKSRIHELADAVRATLSQKTIALRDYETSGTPVVGYATLFEPETRDLTRRDAAARRHGMQHVVMVAPGVAQQT